MKIIRINPNILFLSFLVFLFFSFLIPKAGAENLSSDSYQIQMGHLNMGAGIPTSDNYQLGITGGQTAPGLYSSTGYRVLAGFWYLKTIIPFAFTISDTSIDFGPLTPGSPSTETNTLTVSAGGAGGYQVTARENDLLTSGTGATIPDTTCNGDGNTCTETSAKIWTDDTKYGFGYNMSGNDIPEDFDGPTYFRPFPSAAATEDPAVVMSRSAVGKSRQATVTYKINISSIQAAGNYENYIIFVAIPSF